MLPFFKNINWHNNCREGSLRDTKAFKCFFYVYFKKMNMQDLVIKILGGVAVKGAKIAVILG
jgi:hypothetical protein